jgi:hypothetical protein
MSQTIVIGKEEKIIQTHGQFFEYFGFNPYSEDLCVRWSNDQCLSFVEIENALTEEGISFRKEPGVFFVDSNWKIKN